MKGLPISYFKDLQDDKALVFDGYDTLKDTLLMSNELVKNIYPNKIRISHDDYGKPFFIINKTLSPLINELEVTSIHLSISDTSHYSTAIVITENNGSS